MKKEKEKEIVTIITSGFVGLAIGVCSMVFVNVDKGIKQIERLDNTKFTIQENIATCGDIIEWMNYDVENYADSTIFDSYIDNLEQMITNNQTGVFCFPLPVPGSVYLCVPSAGCQF